MAIRPRFKRDDTFIVCKPIRLSSKARLEPGTKISLRDFPLSRLRWWYKRRRIAQDGCAWAENVLAGRYGASVMKTPSEIVELQLKGIPDLLENDPQSDELIKAAFEASALSIEEWNSLKDEDRADHIINCMEFVGEKEPVSEDSSTGITVEQNGSWFIVSENNQVITKVHGQAALDQWLEENGYAQG